MTAYPARSYSFAHIDAMRAIAQLHQIEAVPITKARVLEIGCASGGHLIPMAARNPMTTFVGLDLDPMEIKTAKEWAVRHQLENIEFHCCAAEGWSGEAFDYIICHGVLSWIAPSVRISLLKNVERLLSARGIAMLSHATPAGSAAKLAVRELFLAVAGKEDSPQERIAKGKQALHELVLSFGGESNSFIAGIKEQYKLLKDAPAGFLLQDIIPDHFQAISLKEMANSTGLAYVCDAFIGADRPTGLSAPLQKIAQGFSLPEERSHFLDVCKGRSFRRGVWSKVPPKEAVWERIENCYLHASIQIQPGWNLEEGKAATFRVSSGREIGVHSASSKGIVTLLASRPEIQISEIIAQFGTEGWSFLKQLADIEAITILAQAQVGFDIDPYIEREMLSNRHLSDAFLEMITLSHFDRALILALRQGQDVYSNLIIAAQRQDYELHVDGALCTEAESLRELLPQLVPQRIRKLQWQGIINASLANKFL